VARTRELIQKDQKDVTKATSKSVKNEKPLDAEAICRIISIWTSEGGSYIKLKDTHHELLYRITRDNPNSNQTSLVSTILTLGIPISIPAETFRTLSWVDKEKLVHQVHFSLRPLPSSLNGPPVDIILDSTAGSRFPYRYQDLADVLYHAKGNPTEIETCTKNFKTEVQKYWRTLTEPQRLRRITRKNKYENSGFSAAFEFIDEICKVEDGNVDSEEDETDFQAQTESLPIHDW